MVDLTAEERAALAQILVLTHKAERVMDRLTKSIRDSATPAAMDRILSRIDTALDSLESES
jgi:hypothetical protein